MCYSALIKAEHTRYVRAYGVKLSLPEYHNLFERRLTDPKIRIPKAIEADFANPQTNEERRINTLIDQFKSRRAMELEEDLFAQRKRLAEAERKLQIKPTKGASEEKRKASSKIEANLGRLSDLNRTDLVEEDARIFPGTYAHVMVMEDGQRVLKPMRYQCRPAGRPAFFDTRYPGTYNARRDSLDGYWRDLFGYTHGIMVVEKFFENVKRGPEGSNVVLEFRPPQGYEMLVACLWSRWTAPGEPDLLSFAAITDEPPEEVAAAGHDRCIVPIKPEYIDAWLTPHSDDLATQQAILEDRDRPYYEHRLAA